ncbi:NADPH-dependent FMN reductase [Thermobispora bispora]|uniref:NADPH-dependent FMN reductase n=1 Tax=Thermobispora bispora (strain ATCC 19993 / DSM 43833 / CBS 139.67 / JCM 10125 / KCTC 9307 / NBRC 14880 / R51) TaxID=469371 RepID=D6Y774_THEBD|nr:NAD(P)H-dependent oxidoreductase [Thermobispora bispora]ADG87669.1 NADPH-dependent FMN reductase [Thermobispora bispora DSM 43833]QSI47581.1 NADPH-dependent oxidoreductase [Thermobispora bispora]
MAGPPIRLAAIVASTREGRFADTVANWFIDQVTRYDVDLDVIDLKYTPLPAVMRAAPGPEVRAFAARIGAADAFVVITCEYNHGYPASLKLAIDSVRDEWRAKPVAFVSYGGLGGGLRAVEQLKQVFAELEAVLVRDSVSFHMAHERFDDAGRPRHPEQAGRAAAIMLDRLLWWAGVLRDARKTLPPAA